MNKKLLSLGITAALMVTMLVSPVAAVSETELALSSLQSMGVVETDTPALTSPLTRAQFADMVVELTENTSLLSTVATRSLFSDVTSSHWASSEINLVYLLGYMNGNGDGTFAPDRTITLGEAVTTVLRILGYTTADIGYSWPSDYISAGVSMGLLDYVDTTASTFTYGDGLSLLSSMLVTETASGRDYMDSLGASSISDVLILGNNESNGVSTDLLSVVSNSGYAYYAQSILVPDDLVMSCRGTLLLNSSGAVCGFIPNDETRVTVALSDVSASGVYNENGTLTMVSSSATLVLGDTKTTFGASYYELEKYSGVILCYGSLGTVELVIPQSGASTAGYVVTGYYEGASPNPSQPDTITVAGATFDVTSDAAYQFASIAYGDKIHITLDDSGDVTAVCSYQSYLDDTMIGVLNGNSVTLTCGVTISGTISTTATDGDFVRVYASAFNTLKVYQLSVAAPGSLDLTTMKLGDYDLADTIQVYEAVDGHMASAISLSSIAVDTVSRNQVDYYHLDDNGDVDIILLNDVTGDLYTYGIITVGTTTSSSGSLSATNKTLSIVNGSGSTRSAQDNSLAIYDGEVGGIVLDGDGDVASSVLLTSTGEVSLLAFDGDSSVVADGIRYTIDTDVQVYSEITESWMTLATAKAYSDTFECFYDRSPEDGGKIRVIFAY